ncbi:MAG: hypothetical protein ACI9YL_002091 [Luteibaculaceae bacterium]|jgi:hypothetical protein
MKLLSKLSPAETMLLIDSACPLKDMMKFTFMDLLLKRIIELKVEKKSGTTLDKYARKIEVIKTYKYAIPGANFKEYRPNKHEVIFLSPFQESPSLKILFKHLVKMAYENAGGKKAFKKTVQKSEILQDLLTINFFQGIFGGMSLTKTGVRTKNEIHQYLKPIDENIPTLIQENKVHEILLKIGGNIFLLNNMDFALLRKVNKQLLRVQKSPFPKSKERLDKSLYYFPDFDEAYLFDTFFDDFDNTLNSFDTNFDAADCSSCSGDSGCSSCSSCGGCN